MTRLLLHVGDHKTGTSTIQRTLANGAGGDGLIYPRAGRADGEGHQNLAWEVGRDPRFRPQRGCLADCAAEVAGSNAEIAVLSAEAFEFKSPRRIVDTVGAAFEGAASTFDVVLYLRPHPSRILSSFAERLKCGIGPFDMDDWINAAIRSGRFAYAPRLVEWREAVEAAGQLWTLNAGAFDRGVLRGGDVQSDFLERHVGVASPARQVPDRNRSPSPGALRLMQIFGEAMQEAGGERLARALGRRVAKTAVRLAEGDWRRPDLTRDQAERIMGAFSDDAAEVDAFLFGGASRGLFTEALAAAVANAEEAARSPFEAEAEAALRATARLAAELALGGCAYRRAPRETAIERRAA